MNEFWKKITNIGLKEQDLGKDEVKIRLVNQLAFVTLITSILVLISHLITGSTLLVKVVTLVNIVIEALTLFLNYKKKYQLARHMVCIVFPVWIGLQVMMHGENIGEIQIFTAVGFIAFIMYEGQRITRFLSIALIFIVFAITKFYTITYFPERILNPYDEIITFPSILIVLGLIFMLYQHEISKHEEQKNLFIKNLEKKNKKLLQLNSELEEFTYIASHDLKTPLRVLISHVGLARRHFNRKQYNSMGTDLSYIEHSTKQMYALVNDILEYKSIHNSKTKAEEVDLNRLCNKVNKDLHEYFSSINGQVIYDTLPIVHIRQNECFILFHNIIENGVKYNTSEQPTVWITHEITDQYLELKFKDNGIGIKPIFHERIFKFFKRLHSHQDYVGTGVGLGLCKKIVSRYDGQITVNSAENEGATFTLTLPKKLIIKKNSLFQPMLKTDY